MSKIKLSDRVNNLKNSNILSSPSISVKQDFLLSHSNVSDRIKLSHLYIDDRTQRGIDSRRAKKIIQMAGDFNPYKFGMPLVAQDTNGTYFVVDGQGRCIAALLAGFEEIPYQKMVKPNAYASDSDWWGELFITQYDNTETVAGWQLYDVASKLNYSSMQYKSGKQQVNKAKDIERLLLKLNSNNNGWTFGYHIDTVSTKNQYTVDLTKSYQYVVNGIIRPTHNFVNHQTVAGNRDSKPLEAAINVFAEFIPNEVVVGQNLEVFTVYIKKTAEDFRISRGLPAVTNTEINDAAKRLCYILNYYSHTKKSSNPSYTLSHQDLKSLLETANKANKNVATTGVLSLENIWASILKSKQYSQSQYFQFTTKFTIL